MQARLNDVTQSEGLSAPIPDDLNESIDFLPPKYAMATKEKRQSGGSQVATIEDNEIAIGLVPGPHVIDERVPLGFDPTRLDVLPA